MTKPFKTNKMGYTTKFSGELKFTTELTSSTLGKVKQFFGEACDDHPEWDAEGSYIDLEFNKDMSGIKWDSATEKNRGMLSHINLIINEVKKEHPEFGLTGEMVAQGEDFSDRWMIKIVDGLAVRSDVVIKSTKVTCPHCDETFIVEEED